MKVPKYIKKMINDRCKAQMRANELQIDIETWFEAHDIDVEYIGSHVVLYNEPDTTRWAYLEALKKYERR